MENDGYAPIPGCDCDVCRSMRRSFDRQLGYQSDGSTTLDADLASNYAKYLAGELVSKDGRE